MVDRELRRWKVAGVIGMGVALIAGATAGCAGGAGGEPQSAAEVRATLSGGEANLTQRLAAIDAVWGRAESGEIERGEAREAMKKLVWGGARAPVANAAIDRLAEDDEEDTVRLLALRLPTETRWDVIEHVGELAGERGWEVLAPALVRSWSRKVDRPADDERPERKALLMLFPGQSAEEIVFRVFSDPGEDSLMGDRRRTDAWALLGRIDPTGERTTDVLRGMGNPTDDDLIADLQRGARELGAAPMTTSQLEWLRRLAAEHGEFWARAAGLIEGLTEEQRTGLQLRHAAAIVWAAEHEARWLGAGRGELLGEAEAALAGVKRHRRREGYADAMGAPGETIKEWRDDLAWGDALAILIAKRAIGDADVVRELFVQADHDRRDESTEHGGILDAGKSDGSAAGFVARHYPPAGGQRYSDTRFVASKAMMEGSATALFHYHFHAQRVRNAEYAGPGAGDLEYARAHGRSCLVFTSVASDSLNVDYYQANGARVDLGVIRRR